MSWHEKAEIMLRRVSNLDWENPRTVIEARDLLNHVVEELAKQNRREGRKTAWR